MIKINPNSRQIQAHQVLAALHSYRTGRTDTPPDCGNEYFYELIAPGKRCTRFPRNPLEIVYLETGSGEGIATESEHEGEGRSQKIASNYG